MFDQSENCQWFRSYSRFNFQRCSSENNSLVSVADRKFNHIEQRVQIKLFLFLQFFMVS